MYMYFRFGPGLYIITEQIDIHVGGSRAQQAVSERKLVHVLDLVVIPYNVQVLSSSNLENGTQDCL